MGLFRDWVRIRGQLGDREQEAGKEAFAQLQQPSPSSPDFTVDPIERFDPRLPPGGFAGENLADRFGAQLAIMFSARNPRFGTRKDSANLSVCCIIEFIDRLNTFLLYQPAIKTMPDI